MALFPRRALARPSTPAGYLGPAEISEAIRLYRIARVWENASRIEARLAERTPADGEPTAGSDMPGDESPAYIAGLGTVCDRPPVRRALPRDRADHGHWSPGL